MGIVRDAPAVSPPSDAMCCCWVSCAQGSEDFKVAETNTSELAAFVSYALAFPTAFQSLVDTYDVSGIMLAPGVLGVPTWDKELRELHAR